MARSRREFLTRGLISLGALSLGPEIVTRVFQRSGHPSLPHGVDAAGIELKGQNDPFLKEAMFYKKLDNLRIECQLCPRKCRIADLERGYCGVRENRDGTYYTLVHSRPCSINADPIEKKPLFHFLPGTTAFSIATAGCNIECLFCQNWQISQFRPEQIKNYHLTPGQIANAAVQEACRSIAYTYSEPVIFYEYMYDTAIAGNKKGVKSVMISNGYIMKEPLQKLCKLLAAVKIDLKAFSESFYRDYCKGELKPVLETLILLKEAGIWFEIVVLLIPTLNDSPRELKKMCGWIKNNLGPDVPVHFTRFHPTYKITNLPPTPVSTLEMARQTAIAAGIHFAYVGNVPGHEGEHTYCPKCGKLLIKRQGFYISTNRIEKGRCKECQHPIPGVWS